MAMLLKGASAAAALDRETVLLVQALKEQGREPCLAILRVGARTDDLAYEKAAVRRCSQLGIQVRQVLLREDISQKELLAEIEELNLDTSVHGVLMFRPLPESLNEHLACERLDPKKDVDGITAASMAKVYSGYGEGFAPCTAQSCLELLRHYGTDPAGKRVAVVGRSLVIGRPVAMLLTASNATVTLCHSRTQNLQTVTREADIVICAVGKPEAFGREYFREGQTVLDVGISWSEEKGKLVGDVNFEEAESVVTAITPVPSGVGSVTTAVLALHTAQAAQKLG